MYLNELYHSFFVIKAKIWQLKISDKKRVMENETATANYIVACLYLHD